MHAVFKTLMVSVLVVFNLSIAFADDARFPQHPDAQLTPGETCQHPDSYRYPEHIPYCTRNVDTSEKKNIIVMYDRERGYQIESMDRGEFKIDHYIPLCMGGANERDNLWPQHKTVYALTDPLEPVLCDAMSRGKLLQAKAIELMKQGKADFSKIDGILAYAQGL
jgi:hypothetical protein